MTWSWRDDADAALGATALSTTPTTGWLWWNYGVSGAGPADPTYLPFEVEDPGAPGTYLLSGLPVLDRQLLQVEVIDSSNPGSDAAFAPVLVGPTRLGTGVELPITGMRGNCALKFRLTLLTGVTPSFTYRLFPRSGSGPAIAAPGTLGDGIVTSIGDSTVHEWVTKVSVTETGTPDDKANLTARTALWYGATTTWAAEAITLNQNDGASAALGSGESYYAILTQGASSVTTTKGSKATTGTQTLPAAPAGELPIAIVAVEYGGGGSIIGNEDITETSTAGRFAVRDGGGLTATLGTGRVWMGRTLYQSDVEQTVVLTPSVTRYLWLDGGASVTQTATTTKPSADAQLLCSITTNGSVITAGPTDMRRCYYEPRAERIRLVAALGNEAINTDQAVTAVGYYGVIDRGSISVRTASSGGATGNTTVAIKRKRGGSAATIATGSIAAGSYTGTLTFTSHDIQAGDYLALDTTAVTTGGSRAIDLAVELVAAPVA